MLVTLTRRLRYPRSLNLRYSRTLPTPIRIDRAAMATQQPPWAQPASQNTNPVLRVYNSLTKSKVEFIPENGNHVKWYNCGPTVYDASHMGHARNYVTQDILRRIMSDYFGYDVHFVMNITDIEDKIIKRARQNHLLDELKSKTTSITPELVAQVDEAWSQYTRGQLFPGLPESDRPAVGEEKTQWSKLLLLNENIEWRAACLKRDEKFGMHFTAVNQTLTALQLAEASLKAGDTSKASALALIDTSRDILAQSLDKKYGSTVTDPAIFRALSSYWEEQFFEDMRRLRVRDPDTLTRVTEYVPEVVAFVEKIVANGYGYEVDGSVYFNTAAFDGKENHAYAKLEPWSRGNLALLEEGEGSLGSKAGRKSASDFVLWKASKAGEPSWPSPWGPGRPGWHIECSVMASEIFGDKMDIHSGGIDLAFPHHDNEMAQSEAYHECSAWVNYFLHTGHLHIEGLKMSKSLKNFITIDEILQKYTARQLRLAFLTQLWNAKVDFSESLMTGEVRTIETTFNNFFANIKALVHQLKTGALGSDGQHHYAEPERSLVQILHDSQTAFRAALCDSFNTPQALDILRELVSATNVYINTQGTKNLNVRVVQDNAQWIGRMLRMFGLGEGERADIGWGQEDEHGAGDFNREEILMPYLGALSNFRDGVRRLAIAKNDNALKEILALCDKLRDQDLVPLGVALDDQEDGNALVKLVSPAELIKAREEKRAAAEAKAAKKAATAEQNRQRLLQKMERGRLAPYEMFKPPNISEGTYSSWNEDGIPLTDGEGKELTKSKSKNVQKEWNGQKKLHEEFLAWEKQQSGASS